MNRVGVLDTSLYCCWLGVPGKDTAGSPPDLWNQERVQSLITDATKEGRLIVLPLATIIETGNHIAQASHSRFEAASSFCDHIRSAVRSHSPWVPFVQQLDFWSEERIVTLTSEWPQLASSGLSFADATIKDIANHYSSAGMDVKIFTADAQLRAYQPPPPQRIPRRTK